MQHPLPGPGKRGSNGLNAVLPQIANAQKLPLVMDEVGPALQEPPFIPAFQRPGIVHPSHGLIVKRPPAADRRLRHRKQGFNQLLLHIGNAPHFQNCRMQRVLLQSRAARCIDFLRPTGGAEGYAFLQQRLGILRIPQVNIGLAPVGDLLQDQAGDAVFRCKYRKVFHWSVSPNSIAFCKNRGIM